MTDMQLHERIAGLEAETRAQTKILTAICREVKEARRDYNKHEMQDERRFNALELGLGQVKSDLSWTKKIGAFLMTAGGGILHWLHLK